MVRILVAPVGGRGCVRFLRSAARPHFVSVGLGFSTLGGRGRSAARAKKIR